MSDFDDYFTDDIFLDEQTLAVLDSEEQKYLTQVVQTIPSPWPPTKRQKTNSGWTPGLGNLSRLSDESENLPEISLKFDGSYDIQRVPKKHSYPSRNIATDLSLKNCVSEERVLEHTNQGLSRRSPSSIVHVPRLTAPLVFGDNSQHRPNNLLLSRPQTEPIAHQQLDLHIKNPLPPPTLNTISIAPRPQLPLSGLPDHGSDGSRHELQKQLHELQQKLEQVSKDNLKIQTALNEATIAKMAREGEVTVLRKKIEKSAQDYAAQLTRLKAEKAETDAKQARLQKEMREEVERIKTQVLFKQHEQEAMRKSLPPGRSKSTPKERPSQMKSLSYPGATSSPGFSNAENSRLVPRYSREAHTAKKINVLPGFQNAFGDTPPPHTSQKRLDKEIQDENAGFYTHRFNRASPDPQNTLDAGTNISTNNIITVDDTPYMPDADYDVEMVEANDNTGAGANAEEAENKHSEASKADIDTQEMDSIEPFNWTAELNRIVLMHSLPSCANLTIHLLLGAPYVVSLPPEYSKPYFIACTRILETFANPSQSSDWEHLVKRVSQSFVSMASILRAANSLLPLAALLNLLAISVYSLPGFGSSLLSCSCEGASNHILVVLCGIIQDQRGMVGAASQGNVIAEVINLLEALCFNADDDTVERLAFITRNRQILVNLLRGHQAAWFLARIVRFFIILASHPKLCRSLLSMTDPEPLSEEKLAELSRTPLFDHLCSILVDMTRNEPEFRDIKTSIITFFAFLSMSQPDVHACLQTSTTVIPSIVIFLSQLTTAFWEDDDDLVSASPDEILLAIRTLNQTLLFLHHLIFTSTSLNFRHKLHVPQHRSFHGLMHQFIVTFGRLTYGEAPEWIDQQGRTELVSLTEIAKEVLDHVVDGPEADRTWQIYQTELDTNNDTDEEDMEAKLLGE